MTGGIQPSRLRLPYRSSPQFHLPLSPYLALSKQHPPSLPPLPLPLSRLPLALLTPLLHFLPAPVALVSCSSCSTAPPRVPGLGLCPLLLRLPPRQLRLLWHHYRNPTCVAWRCRDLWRWFLAPGYLRGSPPPLFFPYTRRHGGGGPFFDLCSHCNYRLFHGPHVSRLHRQRHSQLVPLGRDDPRLNRRGQNRELLDHPSFHVGD